MGNITDSLESMLDKLIQAIPNVIYALLLLLLAWIIAKGVKALITKVFVKMGFHKAISKAPIVQNKEQGEDILKIIGNIVYYLIFILFLPSILNALGMDSVAKPITNMMDRMLTFIPNLIAAAIILVLGVFIARLIKDLIFKFLQSLHIDGWYQKLNPDSAGEAPNQYALSNVLANVVYVLVLIPVITMALDALNIKSITEPVTEVLNTVLSMIPNIFVAIVLVVLGYYIAKFVGNLLFSVLKGAGIDRIYQAVGVSETQEPSFDLSRVLTNIVKFIIVLFFTVEALNVLQLEVLNNIGSAVLEYLPLLVSALLILGIGFFIANLLDKWIRQYTGSKASATIIKYVIIVFAVFMTLDQLQFATSIVNLGFLLILGGLMTAFAISFGIGGREFAKNQLSKAEKKINKETHKNQPGSKDEPPTL
ncbi:mechanosensitive ion channel [Allobacillus sp. GCM10007491]|uniref:Mechanosensitive ion channel n=1 Tax=Allobacillus saliphilus TaxID=2912308 RepID=A0A941CVA0_9BACI|nr:mechanosensitive ion channel [Allobacillus saliphilus]MBR7553186.1 mechanosensitive ion channel [Allobacillus saliphilus]